MEILLTCLYHKLFREVVLLSKQTVVSDFCFSRAVWLVISNYYEENLYAGHCQDWYTFKQAMVTLCPNLAFLVRKSEIATFLFLEGYFYARGNQSYNLGQLHVIMTLFLPCALVFVVSASSSIEHHGVLTLNCTSFQISMENQN